MPAISVNLQSKTLMDLENSVALTQLSRSKIVEKAIKNYLIELQEDYEDARDAEILWKEFVESGEEGISLNDYVNERGL